MTLTLRAVLFIAAVVCFVIAAIGRANLGGRIDWQNAGLALMTLALLV